MNETNPTPLSTGEGIRPSLRAVFRGYLDPHQMAHVVLQMVHSQEEDCRRPRTQLECGVCLHFGCCQLVGFLGPGKEEWVAGGRHSERSWGVIRVFPQQAHVALPRQICTPLVEPM